jgi:hypothetical protein
MVAQSGFRIGSVHAYVVLAENGDEGIAAFLSDGVWMPMICADMARVESMRPMARRIAKATGQEVRLVKFATRTDVETIGGGR